MDVKLALKLVERLQKRGLNVSALSFMGPPDETNESPATLGYKCAYKNHENFIA